MLRFSCFFLVMLAVLAISGISYAVIPVEVAISTHANWWGQAAADHEMDIIKTNLEGKVLSIDMFAQADQDALADWTASHTNNANMSIIILCGQFPNSIYPKGNAEPDGSIAEEFLDAGNMFINTGDYIFYVVDGAGDNGQDGLKNMIDVPDAYMWPIAAAWTADVLDAEVTADGKKFTPSLKDFQTARPIQVENYEGTDWELELSLADCSDDANRVEPGVIHNTVTDGRIAVFYQNENQDNMPRGAVFSEFILNWVPLVAGGQAVDAADKLTMTWGSLKKQ